jgi:VWFA-related protein
MRTAAFVRLALVPAVAVAVCLAGLAGSSVVRGQAGARERTLFVSAVDSRGEPIEGLSVSDFVVTEDGRRREILRVSRAIEPMDIAVLVDNSAASSSAIMTIRRGLAAFASTLGSPHQIAIVALADRPTILVDYTSSRERIDQGIGRLFAMQGSGMTLLDAIVEVSAGLRRREATRAVIVPVITNGAEFSNRYSREVIAALTEAGAGLHGIVIGHLGIGSIAERERAIVFDAGTRGTGGQHVTLLIESAAEQALQKLARELSSQYKVVYGRPESLIPPEKIEVAAAKPGITMRGTPARGQPGA